MYYIYSYLDPFTMLPFYIGKGSKSRAFKHLDETYQNTENKKKYARIESLRKKGCEPIIEFLHINIADEMEAYEIEKSYIHQFGRLGIDEGGILCNICIDNNPPNAKGRKLSDAARKTLSESRKGSKNPMFGRKGELSPRYRIGLPGELNGFYGKKHRKESMDKMVETKKKNGTLSNNKGKKKSKGAEEKGACKWEITFPNGDIEIVTNLRFYAERLGMHPETLRKTSLYKKKEGRLVARKLS